eukprot:74223_1
MSSSIPTTFKKMDEDYIQQMVEFIPAVGILGWTVFLQALGNQESDNGLNCSTFRIAIQWIYLFGALLVSFWYYIQQSHMINNGQHKVHMDKKVVTWKYVASHMAVTLIYLLTVQTQPIACHLQSTKQLSHLYIIQVAVVLLTTAVLKLFHAISFEKLSSAELQDRQHLSSSESYHPPTSTQSDNP